MRLTWFVNFAILVAFIKVFEIPSMIPLFVDELGIDYAQAGTFMSAYALIRCIASFPAGSITDRWGAIPVIGVCLAIITIFGLLGTVSSSYELLITARIIVSIGITVIFIAAIDAMPKYMPAEQSGRGIGYINVSLNVGIALSMFMTPVMADMLGWRWTARVYSLSFLLLLVLAIPLLRNPPPASNSQADNENDEASMGFLDLLTNLPVMLLAIATLVVFVELYGVLTWVPIFLSEVYSYTPAQVGTGATMFGIAAIPASLVTGYLCNSLRRITWLCVAGGLLAGSGILVLSMSGHMPLWLTVVTIIFITWGHTQVIVSIMSLSALVAPPQSSGRALGLIFAFGYGGAIVPTFLGGYLLERTGAYQVSFGVFSTSAFVSIIAMLAVCKILRNNPPAHFVLAK